MMMMGIGMPIIQARMPFMAKSFPMRVGSGTPGGRRGSLPAAGRG